MRPFLSRRGEVGNGDSHAAPRPRRNIATKYNFYRTQDTAAAATWWNNPVWSS